MTPSLYDMSSNQEDIDIWDYISPERRSLLRLKRLSLRGRVWFKILSFENRRLIDAVIAVVEKVRSSLLLKILAPLIKKLLGALGGAPLKREPGNIEVLRGAFSLMDKAAYKVVRFIAKRISLIAQGWGYREASNWPEERSFLNFLIVKYLPRNGNFLGLIM